MSHPLPHPPSHHIVLSIISLVVLLPSQLLAQDYRRMRTDGGDEDSSGPYLYWRERSIGFSVDASGCPDIDPDQARAAVIRAFNTWESQPCSDIFFIYDGMFDGLEPNYFTGESDGHNLISWVMDWPEERAEGESSRNNKLAITSPIYNGNTGELTDVDIIFNARDFYWTAGDRTVTDIENVLVHEIGHLLGFAHTDDPEASLYDGYVEGEIDKRDISATDIHGLCEVYPSGHPTPDVPDLGIENIELTTCSSSGARHGDPWLPLIVLGVLFFLRRNNS